MTHTPTPWAIGRTREIGGPFDSEGIGGAHYWHAQTICNEGCRHIADVTLFHEANDYSEANANAEFIVRAVNAHDELVEACERVLQAIEWSTTEERMTEAEQAGTLRAALAKAQA